MTGDYLWLVIVMWVGCRMCLVRWQLVRQITVMAGLLMLLCILSASVLRITGLKGLLIALKCLSFNWAAAALRVLFIEWKVLLSLLRLSVCLRLLRTGRRLVRIVLMATLCVVLCL